MSVGGAEVDGFCSGRGLLGFGLDEGITDALFRISEPRAGAYFWFPPLRDGAPDLRVLLL